MNTKSHGESQTADMWQRAAGGMVASASHQAEASAVRRGLLASRLVSAALRADGGELDDVDSDALATLLKVLESDALTSHDAQGSDDVHAFAQATRAAAPGTRSRAKAPQNEDLGDVKADASLLLAAAKARGRARQFLFAQKELTEAAGRLVVRFAAVSESAMAGAGAPGDSLGAVHR